METEPNLIKALVTVAIFLLLQTGGLIWLLSEFKTTFRFFRNDLDKIEAILSTHQSSSYRKEDAIKDFTLRDQQIKALWDKYDRIVEKSSDA